LGFYLIWLDTALNQNFEKEIPLNKNFIFKKFAYSNNQLVLFFQTGIEFSEEMLFITFNINDGNFNAYTYTNLVPMVITHFEKKNNAVIFGGNVKNKTVVILYDFSTEKALVLPGIYNLRSSLIKIVPKAVDDSISIITSELNHDKSYGIRIRTYTANGELSSTKTVNFSDKLSLTNGRLITKNDGDKNLVGIYTNNKKYELSNGFFISNLNETSKNKITYYNYSELENFLNHLPERRKNRIKKRVSRKKLNGKKSNFNYQLILQEVIRKKGHNILIGVVYNTQFNTGSGQYILNLSNPTLNRAFEKHGKFYKYTHAIIVCFNDNGEVLWDNNIEINDLESTPLEKVVHVSFSGDHTSMLYIDNQEIKAKVIRKNETLKVNISQKLKLLHKHDELIESYKFLGGLEKWYGNNFYAYGVNEVKNLRDQNIKLNRKVFFINKIVVE